MATAFAFVLSFILVPGAIFVSRRLKMLSQFSGHRFIQEPVPLLGGVAIYLTFVAVVLSFRVEFGVKLVAASLPIFIMGLLDDSRELKAKPKFLLQMIPIFAWCWIHSGGGLIFEQIGMPTWLAIPLSVFWVTAITNGMNLIDGMDGAAGGTAFIVALMLSVFSSGTLLAEINLVIAVSVLSFLFFNLPKAKIYLGNNGSYTLGFLLSASSVVLTLPQAHPGAVAVPLMILAFPQVDTLLAMTRRLRRGQSLVKGDHEHIHHKLQNIGLNVVQSLAVIFFVNAYAAIGAYAMWQVRGVNNRIILLVTTVGLLNILAGIYFTESRMLEAVTRMVRLSLRSWLLRGRDFAFDTRDFSALVVDLERVYPHLQPLIPERWASFIVDLTAAFEKHFKDAHFTDLGPDRVGVVLNRRRSLEMFGPFFVSYEELLRTYNIPRQTEHTLPLGLLYYSSSHGAEQFLRFVREREQALAA
ncbi:MAG TPA: MraY family glycosyltransferase [Bdellovibrionales bacterium]|nr:MraY family glycosyltransferase [Bdellovibrionales bacterium]